MNIWHVTIRVETECAVSTAPRSLPFAFQSRALAANPKACSKEVLDSAVDGGGSDVVSA